MGQLLQCLLLEPQSQEPAPAAATKTSNLKTSLKNLLSGSLTSTPRSRPGPMRRDWTSVMFGPVYVFRDERHPDQ